MLLLLALASEARGAKTFKNPTNSSPIQISANARFVWVVNPAGDSVSVIRTRDRQVVKTIKVGDEPQSLAIDPEDKHVYVANTAAGTVTVIRITNKNPNRFNAKIDRKAGRRGTIKTGAEPWDIVITPDNKRVFVANASQDTISVINTEQITKGKRKKGQRTKPKDKITPPKLLGSVTLRGSVCSPDPNIHFQPRGLAVNKAGTKLWVTAFFSFTRQGFRQVDDEGRQGIVCRLTFKPSSKKINQFKPSARFGILPQPTGFNVDQNGDAQPDPSFAWPNQMQSIVVRGNQAYMPNIAASPEGPQRFNNSTQAFVNVLDGTAGVRQTDGSNGRFLNLHLGARTPEAGKKKLFFANPWAIAFNNQSGNGVGYVVSAGSDLLVKVNVDGNGALSFTGGPQTTRYVDLNDPANPATAGDNAGKNPQGIVIDKDGEKAYVWNRVSANVSVVSLRSDAVEGVVRIAPLPAPGSPGEVNRVGAEIFFGSRGHFNTPNGAAGVSTSERLSSDAWQSCASCHFEGLTDSVVWSFGTGPRKSLPLNASFNPANRNEQKILNYSAVNDEVEDFELNIRNVSGPGALAAAQPCSDPAQGQPATSTFDPNHGLIFGDNGNPNLAPCIINAIPAKANQGRNQFTVTLPGSTVAVPAQDALREWVRNAIRTPHAPIAGVPGGLDQGEVQRGQQLFNQQGCSNCHGGAIFSRSIKDYQSPPAAAEINNERTGAFTGNPVAAPHVGKFLVNIGSFNLGVPGAGNDLGSNIGADEKTTPGFNGATQAAVPAFDALGIDYNGDGKGAGYTVPSLLGIDQLPPYYHNGACETLDCVVSNPKHRTALGSQPDVLGDPNARAAVVTFLRSIQAP
jgi:YVTN family beta-propeller protein